MSAFRLKVLTFAAMLSFILAKDAPAVEAKPIEIYLLGSYNEGDWTPRIVTGVNTGLAQRGITGRVTRHQYLNYRYQGTSSAQLVRERAHLTTSIKRVNPDYIIICDDEVTRDFLEMLYPLGKKIIFTGINHEESKINGLATHRDQITGVLERYPIEESLKLLRDLTKRSVESISLVSSRTESSQATVQQFRQYFASHSGGIRLRSIYQEGTWEGWKRAVHEANKTADAIWFLVPWSVKADATGKTMPLQDMALWLTDHVRIPSLSIVDVNRQLGAMASIAVTPEALGEAAADLLARSAKDKIPIAKIPLMHLNQGHITINIAQADRLGIVVPIEILEYATIVKAAKWKRDPSL